MFDRQSCQADGQIGIPMHLDVPTHPDGVLFY